MLRLRLLVGTCVLLFAGAANAACPSPFVAKDGTGTSQNMAEINDTSNNCVFPNAITDGGGATNRAAVKAASTNPAATDPALVVSISPNGQGGCAGQPLSNTTVTPINNAGSASNLKLVTKVSGQNVYICAINIVPAAANNIALVDGTQTTNQCDTSTAGMAGGATAATGWNFGANSLGLTQGNGQGVIFKSTGTNLDVCLLFSAANQVSGSITWTQF